MVAPATHLVKPQGQVARVQEAARLQEKHLEVAQDQVVQVIKAVVQQLIQQVFQENLGLQLTLILHQMMVQLV